MISLITLFLKWSYTERNCPLSRTVQTYYHACVLALTLKNWYLYFIGFVCDFDWNHFCIPKCGFGDSSDWNNRFIINHNSSFAIFAHFSVPERCHRKWHAPCVSFSKYLLGISRWWRIIWLVTWSLWGLCTFGFSLLSFSTCFNKLRPDFAAIHQEPSELYRLQCHIWLFRHHCCYTGNQIILNSQSYWKFQVIYDRNDFLNLLSGVVKVKRSRVGIWWRNAIT